MKLSPEDPFSIIWTCLTEHEKNEVYQSANIDVPIGYLDCRIPYLTLCYVCYCLQ